ncbi:MAG: hypothetical protein ACI9PP_002049 [Halobacteriales archaeon]|jgi:hypothetical protein
MMPGDPNDYRAGDSVLGMADPEEILPESPVDFETAVAYALHPEMRRLIILYVVGAVLLPVGLSLFLNPGFGYWEQVVGRLLGLLVAIGGATFLFAGLVGAIFKLVTDANLLVAENHETE